VAPLLRRTYGRFRLHALTVGRFGEMNALRAGQVSLTLGEIGENSPIRIIFNVQIRIDYYGYKFLRFRVEDYLEDHIYNQWRAS